MRVAWALAVMFPGERRWGHGCAGFCGPFAYLFGWGNHPFCLLFLNPHPRKCSEKGEVGREGEKRRLTASCAHPNWGADPQPRHVP